MVCVGGLLLVNWMTGPQRACYIRFLIDLLANSTTKGEQIQDPAVFFYS